MYVCTTRNFVLHHWNKRFSGDSQSREIFICFFPKLLLELISHRILINCILNKYIFMNHVTIMTTRNLTTKIISSFNAIYDINSSRRYHEGTTFIRRCDKIIDEFLLNV